MVVLTADKSKEMATLLAMMIDRINPEAEVKSFQVGNDVITAFKEIEKDASEIALVILGYRLLGDMTGAEVAQKLRQKGYKGLIIALSGGDRSDWAEAKMLGDINFCFFHKCNQEDMKQLGVKLAIYTAPTSF